MVYIAKLTKKPNKAPAVTSTSVWPIDSFNRVERLPALSKPCSASVPKPEDICVSVVCLILLSERDTKGPFVGFDEKEFASSDNRDLKLSDFNDEDDDVFGLGLIPPLSLVGTAFILVLSGSVLFSTFA